MSTAKVIFTYKRKRLSSRTGVDHADVCTAFSLDVQADKPPDVPNKKVKSQENDLMDVCLEEKTPAACPSVAFHTSGIREKHDVQESYTTYSRRIILGSDELVGDHSFKNSGAIDSGEAGLGESTPLIEKDPCVQKSVSLDIQECMNNASVSQSVEKNLISPLKQSSLCESEVVKGKLTAPLRTFSRRLKRKLGASGPGLLSELPLKEGDTTIKKCNFEPEPSCAHELASKESRLVEKSVDVVENSDTDKRNMVCHSSKKMISSETGYSSCPCRQSCAESPILRHTEVTTTSQEDLGVAISPSKQTANRTSGSISSNIHNPDALKSVSLHKGENNCSFKDEAVASSCNISSKKDKQPVSEQLQASSADSQLTSGDSSDLKQDTDKRMERSAHSSSLDVTRPPPGAFLIDCNVVPESDVQEEVSDILLSTSAAKESKIVMPEEHKESKGLELFRDKSVLVEDSSDCVRVSLPAETKKDTKYLQLFSEDGNCSQQTLSNTQFDSQSLLAQSSNKAQPALGLSLPTEQKDEGQTSRDGATIHQYRNPNVRFCDFIQNPRVHSLPDQASLRHKLLLESINTRAISLQGNKNFSLDKFESCPAVWSEEELDSLWIGIRRYGRGHWRAMLLDPRLRFAPWRVAGELEEQWEREQYKLFSGQHMPSNRCPKPLDAYKLHCQGAAVCSGTGNRREISADTQLSLGDMYAQSDNVGFRSNAQKLVTMASCSPGGYVFSPFNNVHANGMSRCEASPDGSPMAFGMNNCMPHWLRAPINAPRPLDLPLPPSSSLPSMGGLRLVNAFPGSSGTSWNGANICVINNKHIDANPSSHLHSGGPSTKKPAKADNLIVIDSDASSEETISDDNNVRK